MGLVPVTATGTTLPAQLPISYPPGAMSVAALTLECMDAHPHDPPTRKAQQLLRSRFGQLMDRTVIHVRVDYRDDRQLLTIHGSAAELHGPRGRCTCCPRRPRLTIDGDVVG